MKRQNGAKETHPSDGSLNVSNPTRAFDTLSGHHVKRENDVTAYEQ